jgi:hypothetical protein
MIVDNELTVRPDGSMDIEFSFDDALKNQIFLSIEFSGIMEIKKLSVQNLQLIKNIVDNSLKWIVDNGRASSIETSVTKVNDSRVDIKIYCQRNEESIVYSYYYNF